MYIPFIVVVLITVFLILSNMERIKKWVADTDYIKSVKQLEDKNTEWYDKDNDSRTRLWQEVMDYSKKELLNARKVHDAFVQKYERYRHNKKQRHILLTDWLEYTKLLASWTGYFVNGIEQNPNRSRDEHIRFEELGNRIKS